MIGTGIFPYTYHVGCTFNLHSIINNGTDTWRSRFEQKTHSILLAHMERNAEEVFDVRNRCAQSPVSLPSIRFHRNPRSGIPQREHQSRIVGMTSGNLSGLMTKQRRRDNRRDVDPLQHRYRLEGTIRGIWVRWEQVPCHVHE